MDASFFEFDGRTVAYATYGSGTRAMVLVDGLLFDREIRDSLARALAADGNLVLIVDVLGHGASAPPDEAIDLRRYCHLIKKLLDELKLPEAVIGGTSLGANIALEAAVNFPKRVRGIIAGITADSGQLAPPPARLRQIKTPTLVIGHMHDPSHTLGDARRLAEEVFDGRLIEVRSVAKPQTMPKHLASEIVRFVDMCWMPHVVVSRTDAKPRVKAPLRRSGTRSSPAAK